MTSGLGFEASASRRWNNDKATASTLTLVNTLHVTSRVSILLEGKVLFRRLDEALGHVLEILGFLNEHLPALVFAGGTESLRPAWCMSSHINSTLAELVVAACRPFTGICL